MALTDDELISFNPWWRDPGWRYHDPHLLALADQPMRLPAGPVLELDVAAPGINVLRGPRQVGKSTDLKLLVDHLLQQGRDPRTVIYLALDLLEDQPVAELARSVRRAKALSGLRSPSGDLVGDPPGGAQRSVLLLDEVTSLPRWQSAIKSLWDPGVIREDVVLCTGSSAVDLQQGAAERLPGRRGYGKDYLALPQSFASFASATDHRVPQSPRLGVAELCAPDGVQLLQDSALQLPALDHALALYLAFGGLPAAVAESLAGLPEPSARVRRVMADSVVKELQRKGASIPAAHALLARVTKALGAETNWSDLARDMDVPLGRRSGHARPSHHTLKSYIELLAGGYFVFVTYFWKRGQDTNDLSRAKKLFFGDPLLHTVALEWAPGLRANIPALIENAVALALYRSYEPTDRLAETFVAPERLHVWKTAAGGEIDFVAGPAHELDVVEVKYRSEPGVRAAAAAAQAHPGRPVVLVTKHDLDFHQSYSRIPASLFLWALG